MSLEYLISMDINLNSLPKSAKEARKINSKIFFTNQICKRGHLCERYTKDYKCIQCKIENKKKSSIKYNAKIENKEKKRLYRINNSEKIKKYRENNKKRYNYLSKEWRINNKNIYIRI
jgi:hypothetical protein